MKESINIKRILLIAIQSMVCVFLIGFSQSVYATTIRGAEKETTEGIKLGVETDLELTELPGDERKNSVIDDFIKSCQGKKDARCQKIRNEAVPILKEDILTLGSSADSTYLPDLVKILRSDEPVLRAAAADAMGMIKPTRAEIPELIKAFNDPVPIVRQSIKRALSASGEPDGQMMARRAEPDKSRKEEPDIAPDAKRLGVPLYQNATFLYFSSSPSEGKFAYATSDPVSNVIKHFSLKQVRPAMTKEQFMQAYSVARGTPMAGQDQMKEITAKLTKLSEGYAQLIQKAVKEGKNIDKDPEIRKKQAEMEKLQKELQKSVEESSRVEKDKHAGQILAGEYFDDRIFGSPMFIVLEETSKSGMKRPTRFVVVFEDYALKKTGFVIHVPAGV